MIPATVRSTAPNGDVIVVGDDGFFTTIPKAIVDASPFRLLRVGQRLAVAISDGTPNAICLPS
jgi:hypothetical protein